MMCTAREDMWPIEETMVKMDDEKFDGKYSSVPTTAKKEFAARMGGI